MPRALVLLLATLALGVAACGESDEEKFRDAYEPVNKKLSRLGNDVRDGLQAAESKSDAAIERQFNAFADEIAAVGAEVDELDPPSDIEDDVTKLDGAIDDVEGALRDIAASGGSSNPSAARTATLALLQHGERLDALQQRIMEATE